MPERDLNANKDNRNIILLDFEKCKQKQLNQIQTISISNCSDCESESQSYIIYDMYICVYNVYIYIHIYTYVYIYIYMYIYIYIYISIPVLLQQLFHAGLDAKLHLGVALLDEPEEPSILNVSCMFIIISSISISNIIITTYPMSLNNILQTNTV